ncbi:MAG: ATP-binding protein [Pseudomonadota bacterium]
MQTKNNDYSALRLHAEKKIQEDKKVTKASPQSDEARQLIHELQVHQIELEMQNEELRRVQAELAISHARYFDLYDQAPVGYVTIDAGGLILQANLTASTLLNRARTGLLNRPLTNFILPEDQDIYYRHRKQVLEAGESAACELRMMKNDRTPFWARLDCAMAQDADGDPVFRVTMVDITDRMQAKEAFQIAHDKLEAQFYQAQKMEAVGELAGGVVHDFNNMLNVIMAYAQMAMDTVALSDPLHGDITEIMTACHRATDIVHQLLSFAGKKTIAPKILDLNEALSGMINMLQQLVGRNIKLVWQPGQNLWKIKIAPSLINQILANLTINARDAIAGKGKLTIRTQNVTVEKTNPESHADPKPGQYVLLAVEDKGCGMDKATLARIFEPFFTTKEAGKGTGLGLATVYAIAKKHNGGIKVDSEPGKGTTFNIFLPRQKAERDSGPGPVLNQAS